MTMNTITPTPESRRTNEPLPFRVLFMGSDELACPSLEALIADEGIEVVGAVTQPDRPRGRQREVAACDLGRFAAERNIPVIQPEKIGSPEGFDQIAALRPDLLAVVAYGQYIPESILALPRHGAINLHPSLLPKYRGASPIQSALLHGDAVTGVTILEVDREMDAGAILAQQEIPIGPEETAVELGRRLALAGARLLLEVIHRIEAGPVERTPQDHAQAVKVKKIAKEDARMDWTRPADELNNMIRAYQPWPVAFCELPKGSGHPLRVFKARVEPLPGGAAPGLVLEAKGDGPLVATGCGALRLLELQPEGRKRMSGSAFLCGRYIQAGAFFG